MSFYHIPLSFGLEYQINIVLLLFSVNICVVFFTNRFFKLLLTQALCRLIIVVASE